MPSPQPREQQANASSPSRSGPVAHAAHGPAQMADQVYGSLGSLEVRLATTQDEIRCAQRLRYQVFYDEMSAIPGKAAQLQQRDVDDYDRHCDHLVVVDHGADGVSAVHPIGGKPRVVGTYRMLRQSMAAAIGGFYTQSEFDVAPLIARHGPHCRFLELGRSCVMKPYRNRRTVELLWQGLWSYIREHGISAMIGCASFEGTDPTAHADALSYLHHTASAPDCWHVRAHAHRHTDMNMRPADQINPRDVLKALPPLIKGYIRLGCYVGNGAVVDHQFGTTDVLMILPVARIDPRYFSHFGAPDAVPAREASGQALRS